MPKILFIAAGPYYWGSSRLRCYWIAEQLGAQVVQFDDWAKVQEYQSLLDEFDVFVFQKYGHPQLQRRMLEQGKQVYYDVCDPMWWFSPNETREIVEHVTAVVTSSEALAQDFKTWSDAEVYTIPDTIKLAHYPRRREHTDISPLRFIWYGVAVNRVSLAAAWANLSRLRANGYGIQLTVFDDRPDLPLGFGDEVPTYHMRWNVDTENEILASHDIALLPPYPGPWGAVKSNNKTLTAWACGLPAVDGQDYGELLTLLDTGKRHLCAKGGLEIVRNYWVIDHAVDAWKDLINV